MRRRAEYYTDLIKKRRVSSKQRSELVRKNWEDVASEYGEQPDATIRDIFLRELNTMAVLKHINSKDKIIDVGCGNGFATAEYAKKARYTLGVDYITGFIDKAKQLHRAIIRENRLQFKVGDILDLFPIRQEYGQFDCVISERTLINLASWSQQCKALDELDSLLKVRGKLILTEVTLQGHKSVDRIRRRFRLEVLEKHWNNVYIDENKLIRYLKKHYMLIRRESFSLYILLSRVVNAVLSRPREPSFDAPINKIAFELSQEFSLSQDLGHQILFVFRKKKK